MCTLSWILDQNGYDVFFNRDEQRSRPQALTPQIFSLIRPSPSKQPLNQHVRAVMPTDPQGGGTWLAVNEFGWTFALLNYYQGRLPKGALRSRGQIVKDLALVQGRSEIDDYFESLNLNRYAPFSLIFFAPEKHVPQKVLRDDGPLSKIGDEGVNMIRWTGKELLFLEQSSPIFSSAVKFDEVTSSRHSFVESELNRFSVKELGSESSEEERCLGLQEGERAKRNQDNVTANINIHKSHEPSRSAFSICMHRDDAKTVSFSHIRVDASSVNFSYTDGAPCETEANPSVLLPLKRLKL